MEEREICRPATIKSITNRRKSNGIEENKEGGGEEPLAWISATAPGSHHCKPIARWGEVSARITHKSERGRE
jgi:hypothetical protein